MDYFVSSRQDDFEDTRTLLVVSQVLSNVNDIPGNQFQTDIRNQLVKTLRRTNLPGAGSVNTWEQAVRVAEQQGRTFASHQPTTGPFSFDVRALDQSEVNAFFDDPEYTGPPMVSCLASGANGRTYLLQNKAYPAPEGADRVEKYCLSTTTEGVKAVPVGNISLVSTQQELSCMSFFDEKRTVVDWGTTLKSLKQHALDSEYSPNMCKSALLTMIRMYRPLDQEILAEKNADQIARYLLDATSSVDRKLYHLDRLEKQTRRPGEPLQEAVAKVKLIAGRIYPDSSVHRDRIVTRALMSFVDQAAAKMLSRSLALAQQKGIEPNIDKLTEDIVRYELQTGKHPSQTMSMSRNSSLLPTFMAMRVHEEDDDSIRDLSGDFMANGARPLVEDREDDRKRYLWHFDQTAVKNRDSTRQKQAKLKQPFQDNQAFFTMPNGKPHLYFPNKDRDGYLKVDAYTLPTPEMFAQAVDFSNAGPPEEGDAFLKQLHNLKTTRSVSHSALTRAKINRQTVGQAVINLVTKKIAEARDRYNTRSTANYNTNKSNPTSRESSPGGYNPSEFSTPNTSRNNSRSRGTVKKGAYAKNTIQSRSPSTETNSTGTSKKPPGRRNSSRNRNRASTSREKRDKSSSEARFLQNVEKYPDMKPGINCRPTYNPDRGESCTKCMTNKFDKDKHFEFQCPKYEGYNKEPCQKCFSGHHLDDACLEGNRAYPPPNLNENNPVPQEVTKKQELQKALAHLLDIEKNG